MAEINHNSQAKSIKRYLAIMTAKTIGFALTTAFIVSLLSGGLGFAKAFFNENGMPSIPKQSSEYNDGGSSEKVDPVQEAIVKIQSEYASGDASDYIVPRTGPSLSTSVAAGNVLQLTKENAITDTTGLKSFFADSPDVISDAIGGSVWLKVIDASKVEVLGTETGIRCELDLSINDTTGCVVP